MDIGLNYTTSEIKEMESQCASIDSEIHVNSLNNLDKSYLLQLALTNVPSGTGNETSKEDKEEE